MHGYLSSGKSFAYQTNFFSREFEVFAPDLKGFGENLDMKTPYSLDDYVGEVGEYIYKNGLKSPNIVAHSFGGRIAIKGIATNKIKANKLVLTGSAGLKPKTTIKKLYKKICFNLLKNFISKERLKNFYSKDYLSLNDIMKQSFVQIVNEHLDGYLSNVCVPTLIINGSLDKETPLYMAKKLNKNIKNSTLIVFKGCGHFCFVDKPNKFNMEVKEFLLS